jgi:hypothetical protein
MVFARGLIVLATLPALLETEFLRTRAVALGGRPVVLSLRPVRGRAEVAPC